MTVYRRGRRVRVFSAIVGKPSTPTPLGNFFVEESIKLSSGAVGAPFALALSARSNVLQEFDGGPGQIALHGLMNVGGTLGTAASHGCVRLDNGAMSWLVAPRRPRRAGHDYRLTVGYLQLVGLFERGECDRKILNRQPGRVESRDLVVGATARRLCPTSTSPSWSRRSRVSFPASTA